jgi:hypothetical protein
VADILPCPADITCHVWPMSLPRCPGGRCRLPDVRLTSFYILHLVTSKQCLAMPATSRVCIDVTSHVRPLSLPGSGQCHFSNGRQPMSLHICLPDINSHVCRLWPVSTPGLADDVTSLVPADNPISHVKDLQPGDQRPGAGRSSGLHNARHCPGWRAGPALSVGGVYDRGHL